MAFKFKVKTNKEEVVETPKVEENFTGTAETAVDRSAYNCPACKGEGLDANSKVCASCLGTGKV